MKNYEQVNEALSAQVLWKSATHTHTSRHVRYIETARNISFQLELRELCVTCFFGHLPYK